jgi:hypothetical protein
VILHGGPGVLGFFALNIVRRGGFKAAMFNARIASTLGEVDAKGPKLVGQRLKVHALERDGEVLVGIEVVSKTVMSWEMLPVVLSRHEARRLAVLLQQAGGGADPVGSAERQ